MPLDWAPFVDLVRNHQRFVLTTHVRPDGDGLGSMLALAAAVLREVLLQPARRRGRAVSGVWGRAERNGARRTVGVGQEWVGVEDAAWLKPF